MRAMNAQEKKSDRTVAQTVFIYDSSNSSYMDERKQRIIMEIFLREVSSMERYSVACAHMRAGRHCAVCSQWK